MKRAPKETCSSMALTIFTRLFITQLFVKSADWKFDCSLFSKTIFVSAKKKNRQIDHVHVLWDFF